VLRRRLPTVLLAWLLILLAVASPVNASGRPLAQAEIFATNNTAIITDPADPRLRTYLHAFDHRVRHIIRASGAKVRGSTLLDGVFWSSDLQQTTYERSRRFDVDRISTTGLHDVADLIRKEFHQESVLTFEYLPRTSPRADAVRIEVAGLDVRRLHDGLVADTAAREELFGGSVTMRGHLILVAELADLGVAREFVTRIGGDWNAATLRYGDREFVG
jgi:hypothetical protein